MRHRLLIELVIALMLVAPGASAQDSHGRIPVSYERPTSKELLPAFERISTSGLLESWKRPIEYSLKLPAEIPLWVGECTNSAPRPPGSSPRVSLCLEFVKEAEELVGYYLATEPNRQARRLKDLFINGTIVYFVYNGLAKRIFEDLDLPIVVSEDSAADQLAALFLLDEGNEGPAMLEGAMSYFWTLATIERSTQSDSGPALAQKRLLAEQQMFDVMCMLAGSNPEVYASGVKSRGFAKERLARCPREYTRVRRAFMELLAPHRKRK